MVATCVDGQFVLLMAEMTCVMLVVPLISDSLMLRSLGSS